MRRLKLLFTLLFLSTAIYSQNNIPESTFNIGAGVGQPYGGIGLKTLIGKNNSGFFIGLGQMEKGMFAYTVGGQISIKNIFFNLNYGVIGSVQINDGPIEQIEAASFLVGGMIGLGHEKRFFIELAVGHSFGAPKTVIMGHAYSNDGICFNFGIGYRIPNGLK